MEQAIVNKKRRQAHADIINIFGTSFLESIERQLRQYIQDGQFICSGDSFVTHAYINVDLQKLNYDVLIEWIMMITTYNQSYIDEVSIKIGNALNIDHLGIDGLTLTNFKMSNVLLDSLGFYNFINSYCNKNDLLTFCLLSILLIPIPMFLYDTIKYKKIKRSPPKTLDVAVSITFKM